MDTNFDKIFVVKESVSYDIMGEEYELSYHRSEEGAYLKMDAVAKEHGFTEENMIVYNKGYSYYKDNRSIYIQPITLED